MLTNLGVRLVQIFFSKHVFYVSFAAFISFILFVFRFSRTLLVLCACV